MIRLSAAAARRTYAGPGNKAGAACHESQSRANQRAQPSMTPFPGTVTATLLRAARSPCSTAAPCKQSHSFESGVRRDPRTPLSRTDRAHRQPHTTRGPHRQRWSSAAHSSLKFGLRLSTKAAMPSFWSLVANVWWNRRRSKRMPSASVISKEALTASLAIWITGLE